MTAFNIPIPILIAALAAVVGGGWAVWKQQLRWCSFGLLLILVAALLLRFNHINQPFFDIYSWRQTSTAMMADNFYRTNPNIFYPEVNWSGPGPNYQGREFQTVSYLAALGYHVLGQQDWIGRSIAALFGLWGIFALFQLVRLAWDEPHALVAAAVFTVMPGSIFVQRSFLPDPVMVALVITSFWIWLLYLRTDSVRYLLLAAVIGTWGILTKIPGMIIGLPMVYATVGVLWRRQQLKPRRILILLITSALILFPVITYYLWARHLSYSYPPYHFAGNGNWLWQQGLNKWLGQGYFLREAMWKFHHWIWSLPVMLLATLGILLRPPTRSTGVTNLPWLFHWWIAAGIIYYIIGAQELVKNPWNFHIITPAVAALAAHGLLKATTFSAWLAKQAVAEHVPLLKLFQVPAATLLLLLCFVFGMGQQHLHKMYWGPHGDKGYKMGVALQQVSKPDDLVLTMTDALGNPNAIYYSGRRGWIFPPPRNDIEWGKIPQDEQAILFLEELRGAGADWLAVAISHNDTITVERPLFAQHLNQVSEVHTDAGNFIIYRLFSADEVAIVEVPPDVAATD